MRKSDASLTKYEDDSRNSQKRKQLSQTIEQNYEDLLIGIQVHIRKFRLVQDSVSIASLAEDILHDAIVKAFDKLEQYDHHRSARPWLWTIALNELRMLRRRKQDVEDKYVTLVGDDNRVQKISAKREDVLSEDEMFNILYGSDSNANVERELMLDELLSLVKESDREVLDLIFVQGFDVQDLAARFGISEGAVYVRKSRAIARLYEAYLRSEQILGEED